MGVLSLWVLVGAGQMARAQQEGYFNNFEDPTDPLSEWSNPSTDTTPVGARRFLGQFGNDTVSLTLTDLPPHASVRLSFDLFIINTWDGNGGPDIWEVSVGDSPTLLRTTFDNVGGQQAYPDPYPGGDHPPQTGAAEINTLGFGLDAVYQLSFTFPHAASTLVLTFSGIGLEDIGNESWGLDNVRVSVVGTPIVVTTTQESGPGSFRQALLDANANEEVVSAIVFNIPTTDPGFDGQVFTIQPTSALPVLQRPMLLDATTQTTFTGDANALGPEVVLNGSQLASGSGLVISGERTTIQGLIINGFAGGAGIALTGDADLTPSHNQLLHNYLGTDPTGALAVPNGQGIAIQGGVSPEAPAQNNVLQNNVIAGNLGAGITLCQATGTRMTDNRIGTDQAETAPLGNGAHGIVLTCAGTRRTLIEQNTIAFNSGDGVRVETDNPADGAVPPTGPQENTLRRNAIFANGGLGINLVPSSGEPDEGVTPNDSCDADMGGNGLQNFPELTVVTFDGSRLRISGTLNSRPDQPFQLEFFANAAADPSGFGEGQRFLGETTVSTDGTCQTRFSLDLPGDVDSQWLTATATDQAGNTSEFSSAVEVIATALSCQGGGQGVIAGQITLAEVDQGLAGVTVEFFREEDGCQEQTTTDAAGLYQFSNLGFGTYIVLPRTAECRFEPPGWRVGLFGGNAELPFTAHCSD
jgi:hypothetical protein